jgi:hyperosmotically inducible periplasmic protein
MHFSDKLLKKKILNRINWDIRVSSSDINLEVCAGEVKLSGVFDKLYRQKAAIEIIRETQGVQNFCNLTLLRPGYQRSDSELETIIRERIGRLPLSDGEWIKVSAQSGIIRLEGNVVRPRYKGFAARYAWELSGVQDCINDIKISPEHHITAQEQDKFVYDGIMLCNLVAFG